MRVLRLHQVMDTTGLGRSTIYRYMSEGLFPRSIPLGERCRGWIEGEILDWIVGRIEERDEADDI